MTLVESIVDFLRPRQMLVVLDNCEHLLDAAAELAEAILAGCPGVRILATSREGLGIAGEHVWPLRSLALSADAGAAARATRWCCSWSGPGRWTPDFVLDAVSGPAVVEICRRLDGIPLAIELAAARVAAMSPAEIAGHLDERFRLLTGGRRGRVERHQTLQAAVEWSYSLLTDTERTVFDRLGVFPASFDEAAAVAVCAGDAIERWDVIDGLASLVAKSMVGVERSGDATRYQLLETLRHFARDRVGPGGKLDGLRRRHAAHYAAFAERAGAGVHERRRAGVAAPPGRRAGQPCGPPPAGRSTPPASTTWAWVSACSTELFNAARAHTSWGIQAWAAAALPRVEQLSAAQRAVVLAAAAWDAHRLGLFDQARVLGGRVIAESETFSTAMMGAVLAVMSANQAAGDLSAAMAALAEGHRRLQVFEASDAAGLLDAFLHQHGRLPRR